MRKDVDPLGVACLLPSGEKIKMEHGTGGRIDLAITTQIEVVVRKIQIGPEQVGCKKG